MNNFLWILPFLLTVGCGGPQQNANKADITSPDSTNQLQLRDDAKTEVFKNSTGQIRVAIIPVVDSGEKVFLLSVSGVESIIAEHALVHVRGSSKDKPQRSYYATTIDGTRRTNFVTERSLDATSWTLKIPGTKLEYTMYFDAESSASFDSHRAVEKYKKEFASGKIQAVTSFDRAARENDDSQKLQSKVARMQEECGSSVSASVQWEDISDERLLEYAVDDFCAAGIQALGQMCRLFPDATKKIQKAGRILCRFDKAPGIDAGLTITENGIEYRPFRYNTRERALSAAQTLFDEHQVLLRHKDNLILVGQEERVGGEERPIFSGRAAAGLTRQSVQPTGTNNFYVWAADRHARLVIDTKTQGWTLHCGDTEVPLETVNAATRNQILKTTETREEVWKREPYLLARDDTGVYYYVDKLKEELGGRHYQVFIGRRGQQKLSKLTGVVDDSQGTVFSTPKGDLRLVVDTAGKKMATWIRGKRNPKQLTTIDPNDNQALIYDELGAYLDQEYGHICEF